MKDTIIEPMREIPVSHRVDVLVIGGGPAGFATAINAARLDARVMLIEQSGIIGGIATAGLMSHWTGLSEGVFYEELLERAKDTDKDWNYYGDKILHGERIINTEKLKWVMLDMLIKDHVQVQLYTVACQPVMKGNTICGVITESKSGRRAILANIVIDASGDGDIAAKAGVPYTLGRESDNKMQPATIMFKVAGVDMEHAIFPGEFDDDFDIPQGNLHKLARQHLPAPCGHILLYPNTLPGVVTVNMTNCIGVDGTDAADLTQAEYICRGQIDSIINFLRRFVPGYQNCYLLSTAAMLGIRETRHFLGVYQINESDIKQGHLFEDWIATRLHFTFDVHCLTGPGLDETGSQSQLMQQPYYTLPYRCFVPLKVDNLYLCGRNISGTHLAHSNYRVMPICINMGHGIGIAAALAAKANISPRDLDYHQVQQILISQGVLV